MYESFFRLTGLPFQVSPDPAFFFAANGHREALDALRRGLAQGARLMVLTGEIGAGKTTLLRTLLGDGDESARSTVHISGTHLDADTLSDTVSIALGMGTLGDAPARRDAVMQRLSSGSDATLLVVDEAQHLEDSAFEMLEALVGTGASSAHLQICLVGQPELRALLQAPQRTRLRERIEVDRHLGPMDPAETRAYVEHRLRKVGWAGQPEFETDAFSELHACTSGIPRRLNVLCGRLMLAAFVESKRQIDALAVRVASAALRAEFEPPTVVEQPVGPAPEASTRAANSPSDPKASGAAAAANGAAVPLHPQPAHRDGAILCVAGGLGDHVQAAALLRALRARRGLPHARLVGALDNTALQLNSVLLPVGSSGDDGPLALGVAELPFENRAAELASRFAPVVEQHRPRVVIVFNGSEVAWACAEVAHRYGVPVVHVGAGQRTESRAPAADVSRIATDRLSDLLFPSELAFEQCLLEEGVPASRIRCVGSLSMDALRGAVVPYGDRVQGPTTRLVPPHFLGDRHGFGVLWLSAPANITDRRRLQSLMVLAAAVSRDLPLVWPVGNVVRKLSKSFGLRRVIAGERIVCLPAQPYFAAVDLMRNATCLLTDSWRMQDEALALGVPCLMLGDDAKRVGRDGESAATYVGCSSVTATRAVWNVAYSGRRTPTLPFAWDGKTAERIADLLDRASQGWRATGNAVRSP